MEFLFIAFAFGVATGAIARLKGGSFLLWFLVGCALPGIGIFAALFMRDERFEPRRRCPRCSQVVKISDQVCMTCGTDLDYPDPSEPVSRPAGNPV